MQAKLHIPSHTHRAIVRRRRNHIVIERIPLQIEYLAGVADHLAALEVNASRLFHRNHHERGVRHDGHQLRIDCAEVAIVAVAYDADVRVAALLARRQSVHVPKLGRAYTTKPELRKIKPI